MRELRYNWTTLTSEKKAADSLFLANNSSFSRQFGTPMYTLSIVGILYCVVFHQFACKRPNRKAPVYFYTHTSKKKTSHVIQKHHFIFRRIWIWSEKKVFSETQIRLRYIVDSSHFEACVTTSTSISTIEWTLCAASHAQTPFTSISTLKKSNIFNEYTKFLWNHKSVGFEKSKRQ